MFLKFLGNGSGFAKSHTEAYFVKDNTIFFLDCSMLNIFNNLLARNPPPL